MEKIHKDALIECRVYLCKNLDPQYLIDHLIQEKIIIDDMQDTIMSEQTRLRRIERLLDILPTRGSNAFHVFMDSLKTHYPYVIDTINKAVVKHQQQHQSAVQSPADPLQD